MISISLKKNEDRRVRNGHPWVFSNEIAAIEGPREPGIAALLHDAGGGLIGCGYYNPHSLIAFRLLARERAEIDSVPFYEARLRAALALRRALYPQATTFRAVYGESDRLPGLVVDKYGDYLALQILSAGMERRRDLLLEALQRVFAPAGIIARNDVAVRSLEGLPQGDEVLAGTIPDEVEMEENGLHFAVDLRHGQKTGSFLDQKENHLLLRNLCRGKDVLDVFCYAGSWGVHAGHFGAATVLGLDISAQAAARATRNAARNGLGDRMTVEVCDAFERLRTLRTAGRRFGVVVMDPPAFVKSRRTIAEGAKGYLTVNRRAFELLEPGGTLVTCSCSHHISREDFRDIVARAAAQAGREVRLLACASQALDHPILLAVPETEYLKCLVVQCID